MDLSDLAQHARASLTCADTATLLVEGLGPGATTAAALYECDGMPRLACDPGSPTPRAARAERPALLRIDVDADMTVVFTGRLALVGVEPETAAEIVELRPDAVVVHRETPMDVPVHVYFAICTVLREYAVRLVGHTNAQHPLQLREFVARRTGRSVGDVVAAQLGDVDRYGLRVDWVDDSGGQSFRTAFDSPALCPLGLSARVREVLTS